LPLQGSPRGVNDECGKPEKDQQWLHPPLIGALGLSETRAYEWHINLRHLTSLFLVEFALP
jgi:hypothetical protein